MIDNTGKGIRCPSFELFTSTCKEAINKFRTEFPKKLISDLRTIQSNADTPHLFRCGDIYNNILLCPWENSVLDMCRGFLMGCGVSRHESYDAAHFALKHNFWIKDSANMLHEKICEKCNQADGYERHCTNCGACPEFQEVRNHSLMWHDGKVHCIKCDAFVRDYDAG